jgi:hypothetical protein
VIGVVFYRHDLGDGNRPHEQHLGGIVHAWGGHFDLLRHFHDGGGNQQDFDPRKLVSADIEEYRSQIREEELPRQCRHLSNQGNWLYAMIDC